MTACASTCSRRRSSGSTARRRRPKFVYTIPTFQNPAGVTMSLPRRHRLVEIACERELIVLEDNPYGMLRYEGEALPTLHSLEAPAGSGRDADFVVYTGTMSKILSPGVRVGWLVAPRPVLAKLILGKQSPTCAPHRSRSTSSPRTSARATGARTSTPCGTSTAAGAT